MAFCTIELQPRDAFEALVQRALTLTRTKFHPSPDTEPGMGLRDLNELRIDHYRDREKMRGRTVRLQPVISTAVVLSAY